MKAWKKNMLVAFAIIVLIIWAIQFFIYSVGAIIHSLLVVSAVMLFIRFKRWKKKRNEINEARTDLKSNEDLRPPRTGNS